MDSTTISAIIEAARAQPPELQARWITEQTIAAVRAADAAISDQALEAEFRQLYVKLFGTPPGGQAVELAIAWARHLLSGARHG